MAPFVSDISRLDGILRATGAIISGSVALHFLLDDQDWHPRDLDIYVADHQYDDFVELATHQNGLRFVPEPYTPLFAENAGVPSGYGILGIKEVRRFRTPTRRLVDVVRSPTQNPVTPLHAFWSTVVMNFLTPDGCGCAYPAGTLRRQGFLKSGLLTPRDELALNKYNARGFLTTSDPWVDRPDTIEHLLSTVFGDADAGVLYFRPEVSMECPDLPVYHTSDGWRIRSPYPVPFVSISFLVR